MTEPTPAAALPGWIAVIDEPDRRGFACSGPTGAGCMTRTPAAPVWSPRQTARRHIEGEHPEWIDARGCIAAPASPPRGPQDAPEAPGAGPEPEHGASGPQEGADGAALRQRIARVLHRYDNDHGQSGNDIPSQYHREQADAVMAEMRAELADRDRLAQELAAARDELHCAESLNQQIAHDAALLTTRTERAEAGLRAVREMVHTRLDINGRPTLLITAEPLTPADIDAITRAIRATPPA